MRKFLLFMSLALSGLGALSSSAYAQGPTPTVVAVLGIQSVEGDDALAQQLSEALRTSAKERNTWRVLDTSASVQQLSLAHGCNSLDATCLTSISRSLGVTKIVFGTLKRTNRSTDYDFFLKLSIFDLASRQIDYTVNNTVERSVADSGNFNQIAAKSMMELSERPKLGAIIIQVQEPANAEVRVDGNLVLSEDGNAEVTANVPPGRHQLVVAAPGYTTFNRALEVEAGEKTRVTVSLQEQDTAASEDDSESSEVNWLGWGAIGLGAVFLGLSTYSFLRVYAIDNDADIEMYRNLPGLEDDVCTAANNGFTGNPPDPNVDVDRVASLCDEADMLEVLQYVFLAAGVVSVGVGITILVLDDDDDKPKDEFEEEYAALKPRLELLPKFGRNYAMLNATLRF